MTDTTIPTDLPKTNNFQTNIEPEKMLIEWTAPSRPYKKRSREFYTTVGSIAFLLAVIILLMGDFLLIGVIISFAFLSYVLASHQPENVQHQITNKGVRTEGKLYEWSALTSFWIKKQWDQELLVFRTQVKIPGIIMLVIDHNLKEKIVQELGNHLELITPSDSFVDKASSWLGSKIPLENS